MFFDKVTLAEPERIAALSALATGIVREYFDPLIGKAQNDYMINKFQTVAAITQQLRDGYQYYFVCDGQERIGFLAFYPKDQAMYLSKFYLDKAYRGRGYSRQMLAFVIEQAQAQGLEAVTLNVNRNNAAVQAYEHMGFVKTGEAKIDIGGGFFMDDYLFEYRISR